MHTGFVSSSARLEQPCSPRGLQAPHNNPTGKIGTTPNRDGRGAFGVAADVHVRRRRMVAGFPQIEGFRTVNLTAEFVKG